VSDCESLRDMIVEKLQDGLGGQRIYQYLCTEHEFGGI
jgi:hypothetical protein